MAKFNLSATYRSNLGKKEIEVGVSLYSYKEDEVFVVYTPAFDLYGYGSTEQEAKDSFGVTLDEFIKYTHNKGTFLKELERLGWNITKAKKRTAQLSAPDIATLLRDNEEFSDIFYNKNPRKEEKTVSIPEFA